MMGQNKKLKR